MKIFQVCALQPHFDNNINCRAGQGKLFKTPIFEEALQNPASISARQDF